MRAWRRDKLLKKEIALVLQHIDINVLFQSYTLVRTCDTTFIVDYIDIHCFVISNVLSYNGLFYRIGTLGGQGFLEAFFS